jgi:glucose/arabinose dehydrogenase
MRRSALKMILVGCGLLSVCMLAWPQGEPAKTGPQTEKRFPPLQVPPEFKANLFACDPLIEYPSALALGPKPGSLFVAVDYLTGLGTDIIRRDEIRLLEDTDGDGYADKATVFAAGFNSIQGLTFHDGTLYVMHAPYLTALRDTKGTGKADERRDLVTGLGLPPEKDQIRLHNANGVVMGHDGWLYLAMGDRGCDVQRPEGDRLVLEGGGILRCRADGRDLHVFSIGLRNIYDVALDADLNVFVRDNENDGGAYKIRVCQSFFGADHGYPYLYYERPEEALAPLADLGLGSSAGGTVLSGTAVSGDHARQSVLLRVGSGGGAVSADQERRVLRSAERGRFRGRRGERPLRLQTHRSGGGSRRRLVHRRLGGWAAPETWPRAHLSGAP